MGCSSTEIIESPKTTYIVDLNKEYNPVILWTSRDLKAPFDYLGQITARSWQYEGAIERLLEAGKTMGADAIIDIHYEREGFLNIMQAFAVKFK